MNYYEYIKSEAWQDVRKRFWNSKYPKKCYCCDVNDVPLDLHHKTYKSLGHEKLFHLILLCRLCHDRVHKREKAGGSLWTASRKVRNRILQKRKKTLKKKP